MSIDFKNIEVPVNNQYLKPGMYNVKVTNVVLQTPDNKTPYLEIEFTSSMGTMKEKFYLKGKDEEKTKSLLGRLQSLHMSWFDKPLEKPFENYEGVQKYFHKALTTFTKERAILVEGEQASNGKVYVKLPFKNFVLPNLVEQMAFVEGSAQYVQNVKMNTYAPALSNSDETMLPSEKPDNEDESEDLPF